MCCFIQDNNKINVSIAGHGLQALIDSGSTISTISEYVFQDLCKNMQTNIKNTTKHCMLANGSQVQLNKTVTVPIQLGFTTVVATLYVLNTNHISMIIGCDLLDILRTRVDFKTKQFICDANVQNVTCIDNNTHVIGVLSDQNATGSLYNNCGSCSESTNQVLNERVKKINLAESDTDSVQKQQLINLVNNYTSCFANNLNELGRTNVMEYDIELMEGAKPVCMRPYKCAYSQRDIIYEEIQKLITADLIHQL